MTIKSNQSKEEDRSCCKNCFWPLYVSGDGKYYDKATTIEISFCPGCGTKLSEHTVINRNDN